MVIKINKGIVFTRGTYLLAWPVDQLLPVSFECGSALGRNI